MQQTDLTGEKGWELFGRTAIAGNIDIVDAEHIEWPFTGEYWKDELGSYIFDISSKCEIEASTAEAAAP